MKGLRIMKISVRDLKWSMKNFFRGITGRKTLEQERRDRLLYLREILIPPEQKPVPPSSSKEYFDYLAKTFSLDSITVSQKDGSVLASNMDNAFKDSITKSSLFEYISAEIPDTKYLLIKGDDKVHVIFRNNGKFFMVEAPGDISPIELRSLIRKSNEGLNN